jgi:putative acetyltransferase
VENRMIKIKPIKQSQIAEAKKVITKSAFDIWKPKIILQEFEQNLIETKEFDDIDNVQKNYFDHNGIFLVLIDNEKVVGTGAIKYLSDDICELKRMWFLKEYQRKGLGFKLAHELIEFAQKQGYRKIRLDVYHPELQQAAVTLYKKLGFYEIEPYNTSNAKLFMEKIIS